jgi:formate hydrogenlyase transcriptional activator
VSFPLERIDSPKKIMPIAESIGFRATASDERLRFEQMLFELSGRFVKLMPTEVDREIELALKQVLDFFDVDRVGLLGISDDGKKVHVVHAAYAEGIGQVSGEIDLASLYPWSYEKLVQGQIVRFAEVEELPEAAEQDKINYIALGTLSVLDIPLFLGGRLDSIIVLNSVRRNRSWPDEYIPRLRLLGEIFVNALERKSADQALRESEERLRMAADSAQTGLWVMPLETGRFWVTPKARELFGLPPDQDMTLDIVLSMMHPDDRDRVRLVIQETVQSGKESSVEYRILKRDGSLSWIQSRGRPYPASLIGPARLMGVSVDITERKQAEEKLKRLVSLMRATLESTADGILVVDSSGRISDFNEQFGKLWNIPAEVLATKDDAAVMHFVLDQLKSPDGFCARVRELYSAPDAVSFDVIEFKDGRVFERYSQPLNIDGISVGRVWSFRDITARRVMEEQLRQRLQEIEKLKHELERENILLRSESTLLFEHGRIVGESPALRKILSRAEQVARTDSTVLIMGETGTGKELLALEIHNLSSRKDRPMITVNCSCLPPTLIESELFGREKGAYTGALTRMAGRFEVADGSTVFLDEIGELPMELQVKLLRVIEEGTFERLGSTKTIRGNVRLIAATNRDLVEAVRKGTFRQDLYYRLNVFPIIVPPLRDRTQDIPLLAWAFIRQFEKKMGKQIESIPKRSMDALQRYSWPGNIRELKNVIEHAMIVSTGNVLSVQLPAASGNGEGDGNLESAERKHILTVLQKSGWRISGDAGAASVLGVKRTTLQSKMKKLGLKRPSS